MKLNIGGLPWTMETYPPCYGIIKIEGGLIPINSIMEEGKEKKKEERKKKRVGCGTSRLEPSLFFARPARPSVALRPPSQVSNQSCCSAGCWCFLACLEKNTRLSPSVKKRVSEVSTKVNEVLCSQQFVSWLTTSPPNRIFPYYFCLFS